MARILLLIVLGYILVKILKRMVASGDTKPSAKLEEKMLQCANCGCHVPESESHIKNDKVICNNPECQK
jgi:formylmethanofuran dehydrogenase subunit E